MEAAETFKNLILIAQGVAMATAVLVAAFRIIKIGGRSL